MQQRYSHEIIERAGRYAYLRKMTPQEIINCHREEWRCTELLNAFLAKKSDPTPNTANAFNVIACEVQS